MIPFCSSFELCRYLMSQYVGICKELHSIMLVSWKVIVNPLICILQILVTKWIPPGHIQSQSLHICYSNLIATASDTGSWTQSCKEKFQYIPRLSYSTEPLLLGAFAKLRKASIRFLMSVCPHETSRLPLDKISWILIFEYYFKIYREKLAQLNLIRITGTVRDDQYTFFIISHSVLLRVRNISDQFDVFLTVHHSIDLFHVTNLMHTSFILW